MRDCQDLSMKKAKAKAWFAISCLIFSLTSPRIQASSANPNREDFLVTDCKIGHYGGRLVISQRAEPKTLNPVYAPDASSREILALITADLIHINPSTLKTEPALASSWTTSADGREFVLHLRRGICFSDGHPFSASDVLFTFQVHLDERTHSPQRDLLVMGGKPLQVEELDAYTVRFKLPRPYAAAERLFDGIAILPRHLLAAAYNNGTLAQAWGVNTTHSQIAGLGPFRFREYVPGQKIVVDRNPYYWKKDSKGNTLPYLNEVTSLYSVDPGVEALRFRLQEIDVVDRLSAADYSTLEANAKSGTVRLFDLGPGLEYNFLFFNLNELSSQKFSSVVAKQAWFRQVAFRRAVSAAIDRDAIVRLVYRGRAHPMSTHVTPGNKLWINHSIHQTALSLAEVRELLRSAGFQWSDDQRLLDANRKPVTFSILLNAANTQHMQTATLIQSDLRQLGMDVSLVPLEFHTFLNRIFTNFEYEAAIMSLASGDADPNSEVNVWTSGGGTHVWDLQSKHAQASWQNEIDDLMQQQMITANYTQRKQMYDRVQELVWENMPVICLASPDVLGGSSARIENFRPAILSNHTLWNVEEFFIGQQ
jgi:peptide/nickel transport system substrate-binding protein